MEWDFFLFIISTSKEGSGDSARLTVSQERVLPSYTKYQTRCRSEQRVCLCMHVYHMTSDFGEIIPFIKIDKPLVVNRFW